MGWFTKKQKDEDHKLLKEFDACLKEIDSLTDDFRLLHTKSVETFEDNFIKRKTSDDLEKERILFEQQFDVLQKLKFQTDLLIDEGFRIMRNESVLTEKDRIAIKKTVSEAKENAKPKSQPKKRTTKKKAVKKKPKKKAAKKKGTKKRRKKKNTKKKAAKKKTVKKKKVAKKKPAKKTKKNK